MADNVLESGPPSATMPELSSPALSVSASDGNGFVPFDLENDLPDELINSPNQGLPNWKVLRAAERVIRRASTIQAPKVSTVTHIVREEIGTEDVFLLGEHIEETQFGIDNHQSDLLSLVVSVFLKIRLHHVAKLASLELQKGSTRKKLCKTVLFQGF